MTNVNEQTTPKVAVIGCGSWGQNLVRNFSALGALAAVCDRNAEAAARMAQKHSVPALTFPEILANPGIASVVISVPAEQHGILVEESLRAGKHVFVEKPLALRVPDAERALELAEDRGLTLMVGHLLQYHPAFMKLKGMCEAGDLGRLRYVYSNRLNLGKFRVEENILWSFAPHDISMILGLFHDLPETILATGHCFLHSSIADVTTTHLAFASGQAAHIHVSWLHPFKEQRLVVIGESAMVVFDDRLDWEKKLCVYNHSVRWRGNVPEPTQGDGRFIALDRVEPLAIECRHFLDCVSTGARPRTDGREGLGVLRVLDAAQKSMESGRAIRLAAKSPMHDSKPYFVHETAVVDTPSSIGDGTKIWHFSHILRGSSIGRNCTIGQNVVIGPDVVIGDSCKIQNNVSVYAGVELEDGVFCGPSMVFTNVINPRAEVERKTEYKRTLVKRGATIGANATVVCGHTIGRYAMIGAGAVVTKDVPDHTLVLGNPAVPAGHVCSCGVRLQAGTWKKVSCPSCGTAFEKVGRVVRPSRKKTSRKKSRKRK